MRNQFDVSTTQTTKLLKVAFPQTEKKELVVRSTVIARELPGKPPWYPFIPGNLLS